MLQLQAIGPEADDVSTATAFMLRDCGWRFSAPGSNAWNRPESKSLTLRAGQRRFRRFPLIGRFRSGTAHQANDQAENRRGNESGFNNSFHMFTYPGVTSSRKRAEGPAVAFPRPIETSFGCVALHRMFPHRGSAIQTFDRLCCCE